MVEEGESKLYLAEYSLEIVYVAKGAGLLIGMFTRQGVFLGKNDEDVIAAVKDKEEFRRGTLQEKTIKVSEFEVPGFNIHLEEIVKDGQTGSQ